MALDKLVDSTQLDSDLASVANAIRTKGGTSAQLAFPAGFVSAVEAIPTSGGGGGATVIASGTITGSGSVPGSIPVGKKMPKTDFIFYLWVDNGTTITPSSSGRSYVWAFFTCLKTLGYYSLANTGWNTITNLLSYPTVNTSAGTTTNRTPNAAFNGLGGFVRWTTQAVEIMAQTRVYRDTNGFSIEVSKGSDYTTASGITYNWELLYIGSDPTNDIVEVP